jgi:hypothetical protein
MSPVATPPRPVAPARPERFRSEGARLRTLGRRLDSVWEGLRADGAAECPLCGGEMELRAGAGSCSSCGSTLS